MDSIINLLSKIKTASLLCGKEVFLKKKKHFSYKYFFYLCCVIA